MAESPPFVGDISKAFSYEDCCVLLKILRIQSGIQLTVYHHWLGWWPGSSPSFEPMLTQNGDAYTSTALVQRWTMAYPTQMCWRHHSSPIGRPHIPRPQCVKDVIGEKREIVQYTLMHYTREGLYTNRWERRTPRFPFDHPVERGIYM